MSLDIVKDKRPCLLGRSWLCHIQFDCKKIAAVSTGQDPMGDMKTLLENNSEVILDELDTIKPFKAWLMVHESVKPKFSRARQVLFTLKNAVEEELYRLEKVGLLGKIEYNEWAMAVVVFTKTKRCVRLCEDYRIMLNSEKDLEQYPMLRYDKIFATLAEGKYFSVLDLSNAQQQLLLEDE